MFGVPLTRGPVQPAVAENVSPADMPMADPAAEAARPGTGEMQGKMVSVGPGQVTNGGVVNTVAQAGQRSWDWFSRVATTFMSAAEEFSAALNPELAEVYEDSGDEDVLEGPDKKHDRPNEANQQEPDALLAGGTPIQQERKAASQNSNSLSPDANDHAQEDAASAPAQPAASKTEAVLPETELSGAQDPAGDLPPVRTLQELFGQDVDFSKFDAKASDGFALMQQAQQQGGWISSLVSLPWAFGKSVVDYGKEMFSHISADLSGRPAQAQTQTRERQMTAAERNLEEIRAAVNEGEALVKTLQLKLQQHGETSLGKSAENAKLDEPGLAGERLDGKQALSWSDQVDYYWQVAKAYCKVDTPVIGMAVAGGAAPVVGAMVAPANPITGIFAQIGGALAGLGLVIGALKAHAKNSQDKVAIQLIEETVSKLEDVFKRLHKLDQESNRLTIQSRISVSTVERFVRSRKLDGHQDALASRHAVTAGDGVETHAVSRALQRVKSIFTAFTAAVVHTMARVGTFLGLSGAAVRAARKNEEAFVNGEGRNMLRTMTTLSPQGGQNLPVTAARLSGERQPVERVLSQLKIGGHLAHAIGGQQSPGFGSVTFDGGDDGGKYAVPANLTTARALAWHLYAQATDASAKAGGAYWRDGEDLVLRDPDRKFYQFFIGVPSAYTESMLEQGSRANLENIDLQGASGAFHLDDHAGGFPTGAHHMAFETDVLDSGDDILRIRFSGPRERPVLAPLDNEREVLKTMLVELHRLEDASGAGVQADGRVDPAVGSPSHPLTRLMDKDNAQIDSLNNAVDPRYGPLPDRV